MSTSIAEAVVKHINNHPEILDDDYFNVDVTRVRGAVVDFSDLPLSPKYHDLPQCGEKCRNCVVYLTGQCDSIREAFCCAEE